MLENCGPIPVTWRFFVHPSGSLHSSIAHHLHQPSYSTPHLDNDDAETADWTNGCVAMIMGNGFEEGLTFIFEHVHRRSQNSEGYQTYPNAVKQDLILSAAAKLTGISTPFTKDAPDGYRKRRWRSVVPNLRPTETRARAVSTMINAKQKRYLSKIDIKDMDTIARHSRLRG
jgi:hypothetical protein